MDQLKKHFSKREKIYGQYFTPLEVSRFIVKRCLDYLKKDAKDIKALDPACGDGSFLKAMLLEGIEYFEGYDIDENIFEKLSFDILSKVKIKDGLMLEGEYDLVVGNPPFSAKFNRISKKDILDSFKLGKGRKSQAIEVLFLEKFINLTKNNGVIGIILPLGIVGASMLQYVRNYLVENIELKEIIYLNSGIFKNGATTVIIIGVKNKADNKACKFGILEGLEPISIRYVEKNIDVKNLNPVYYFENDEEDGVKLEDLILEIFSGRGFYKEERKKKITHEKTDKIYITAKNVGWGTFQDKDVLYFKGDIDEKYILKENDIIMCRVGQGTIGRCLVINKDLEGSIVDDWFHIIRLKDKKYSRAFCGYFLTENFKRKIKKYCIGTGTPNISKTKLLNIKIPFDKIVKVYNENKGKDIFELSKIIEKELN
ncbi:type I restriction enzyme M protein [Caloramator fervidus]|uniref:site-specific DNA-methyltransferase (adenine-specific) n=1 Tax=Caloramator fervidus TaxID=29344 RepID=A0A1H5RP93_9CLOT|nr:N-6 DNA methylase [Caloramator fervidus]SEF40135.1 type I restriction enzyme M protein [Caloramator fervidus]